MHPLGRARSHFLLVERELEGGVVNLALVLRMTRKTRSSTVWAKNVHPAEKILAPIFVLTCWQINCHCCAKFMLDIPNFPSLCTIMNIQMMLLLVMMMMMKLRSVPKKRVARGRVDFWNILLNFASKRTGTAQSEDKVSYWKLSLKYSRLNVSTMTPPSDEQLTVTKLLGITVSAAAHVEHILYPVETISETFCEILRRKGQEQLIRRIKWVIENWVWNILVWMLRVCWHHDTRGITVWCPDDCQRISKLPPLQ